MGIDFGSLNPVLGTGGEGAPTGILQLASGLLNNVNNLVKGIGYFVGGDFQKALDAGFMKA
ncbi:hypothetical protein ES5_04848 [Dietzia cinnamea P4]|nr:hypothetical protein ES5_04848 [Dietzia cinnamea P4]OAH43602.1 hypothetical protein AYJ66_05055 [Dietzia cinnamea]